MTVKGLPILLESLLTSQRKPLSAPRSVRAVAVYDHHPPHGFGVGFRDREPALHTRQRATMRPRWPWRNV